MDGVVGGVLKIIEPILVVRDNGDETVTLRLRHGGTTLEFDLDPIAVKNLEEILVQIISGVPSEGASTPTTLNTEDL